ncbi:YceI family protein [uncultured Imperialibacter sp.]|uniref:YceI family protein n=1 Tax=uncultured Imperialibacter sp. TaxID=1672639 RepID=UPI0030D9E99C|tara:strand:+ start:33431 stop:33979 length:549 start_codon:yes stop_codon:yes gene_type:complete
MKRLFAITALVFLTVAAIAGQPFKAEKGSKITVSGTSTMHDWTMVSEDVKVDASIADGGATIEGLKLSLPVNTLKSHKSGMDDNAYKALKSDKNPQITFNLKTSQAKGSSLVQGAGKLTIAGVTKDISLDGKLEPLADGKYKLTGSYTLDMEVYSVEPPSFMFGTVSTGKEVTITYEIILTK